MKKGRSLWAPPFPGVAPFTTYWQENATKADPVPPLKVMYMGVPAAVLDAAAVLHVFGPPLE